MRARYANEMVEGNRVEATFVLESKEVRVSRNGDAYLSLRFSDRSGRIGAIYFRPSPTACAVPVGSVVIAKGAVSTYRGRRLLTLDQLLPASTWDPADLASSSSRSEAELQSELSALVRSVQAKDMRRLLRVVYQDKDLFARFSACPATASDHHAYLHGLIEHTVATGRLCQVISAQYAECDADLLVTAALLHDIGTVDGLEWEAGIVETDTGKLVGHVVSGLQRIHSAAVRTKMDSQRLALLEHAIAAHHGDSRPSEGDAASTLEALLLRHADQLDSQAAAFGQAIAGAARADEQWTSRSNSLGRSVRASVPCCEVAHDNDGAHDTAALLSA